MNDLVVNGGRSVADSELHFGAIFKVLIISGRVVKRYLSVCNF